MTVPCSASVSPVTAGLATTDPVTNDLAGPAAADPFAALLALLSGAVGLAPQDVPPQAGAVQAPPTDSSAVPAESVGPVAWAVTTQRHGVVDATPATTPAATPATTPTATPAGPGPVPATTLPTAPAPAPAATQPTGPTRTHSPLPQTAPPTDPAPPVTDDQADQPAVPPAVPGMGVTEAQPQPDTTAPVAAGPGERTHEVAPARHVQPALVEAARGLRHEGGGRTSLVVRLDPPELGAVLVRLTVQDGRVDVQLRTPDLVARGDLRAQHQEVQQVLREQGFDLSSFDVAHGEVFSHEQRESPDRGTPQRTHVADRRPDDHLPVTDDGPTSTPSGTWL